MKIPILSNFGKSAFLENDEKSCFWVKVVFYLTREKLQKIT